MDLVWLYFYLPQALLYSLASGNLYVTRLIKKLVPVSAFSHATHVIIIAHPVNAFLLQYFLVKPQRISNSKEKNRENNERTIELDQI